TGGRNRSRKLRRRFGRNILPGREQRKAPLVESVDGRVPLTNPLPVWEPRCGPAGLPLCQLGCAPHHRFRGGPVRGRRENGTSHFCEPVRFLRTHHSVTFALPRRLKMTPVEESRREKFERHARECLDLVVHSFDPVIRATFTAMATTWLELAQELPPTAV